MGVVFEAVVLEEELAGTKSKGTRMSVFTRLDDKDGESGEDEPSGDAPLYTRRRTTMCTMGTMTFDAQRVDTGWGVDED